MLIRYWFRALALALSVGVVSGCSSASRRQPAQEGGASVAAESGADEAASEKLAQGHAHYAAGFMHELNGEPEAALQDYYKAAINDPADETLNLEVSQRFLQDKQPEKALELLNHAAAGPGASGAIFARLGFVYAQLGKTEQAIEANKIAIKRSPGSFSGYQNLFLSYLQNKQTQQALKVLEQASSHPHPDAEFLIQLSELYANLALQVPSLKTNANAKARDALSRAAAMEPSNPQLRMRLADGFNVLGDYDKAAQLYLDLLKKLPDLPMVKERVHAKLTDIYLRGEDHKHAIEQLQAIVREDPTNPQAYYWLGYIALDEKKAAEAADYFSKTVLLNPDFEQAYYDLANAQIVMRKPSSALETLDKARAKFPQSFIMEFLSAMAFSEEKAYAEAVQHFTAAEVVARASDPKRLNEFFYFQFAAAYERKGDYTQAEKYFEKCLQLAPDNAEAMNYLGYMWAEHGWNLDKAKELIEKALKIEPKNAAYLDSLAWVLFKQNHPAEALEYARQAVDLSEEPDATVYDHLGDILAALNQVDKAREAWTKSLSLEANDDVKRKLDAGGKK